MPIERSIMELPRSNRPEGNPPAKNNFVAEMLAQAWFDHFTANNDDYRAPAIPDAGPYRGSFGGMRCDRELQYAMLDTEVSDPIGIADAWRLGLGSILHERLQEAVLATFQGEHEVRVDLRPIGVPGSSHADIIIDHGGERTLVEVKSVGGFKFKMMATTFRGPAEGPSYGHVIQAALAAKAKDCSRVVLAYISLENLSVGMAQSFANSEAGRFAAEWHYTVEELEPLIEAERERIERILSTEGLAPRLIHDPKEAPAGAYIDVPRRDRAPWLVLNDQEQVIDSGTTWFCGYCPWFERCVKDGA